MSALWQGLGINYSGSGYPWDLTDGGQTDRELAYFKSIGIVWIRAGVVGYQYSKVPQYQQFVAFVKSRGFKVLFGFGIANGGVNDLNSWNNFKAALPALATWAQSISLDIFCTGNEEGTHNDKTTLTNTQVYNDELTVIPNIVKQYFSGPTIYTGSSGEMPLWTGGGTLGSQDYLGHNQYDTIQNFTSKLQVTRAMFGDRVICTEWNAQGGYNGYLTGGGWNNEVDYMTENLRRLRALRQLGFPLVFFFSNGSTGGVAAGTYGLYSQGANPRMLRDALFAQAGHGRIGRVA